MASQFDAAFVQALDGLRAKHRLSPVLRMQPDAGPCAIWERADGSRRTVTVWGSDDPLGLAQHPAVVAALQEGVALYGAAGAGGHPAHAALEAGLAALHGKEAALFLPWGWTAGLAALGALGSLLPEAMILSDANRPAAMADAIARSGVEMRLFRRNDLDQLERLLAEAPTDRPRIVAVESVCGLDGSIAPVRAICDLAERFGAVTCLDESHAVGLYGAAGAGIAEREGAADRISLVLGGLDKAFGLVGGYVAASAAAIDGIRSFAPAFVFASTLPAALAHAGLAALETLRNGAGLRQALFAKVADVRDSLDYVGVPLLRGESHILPVLIGDARQAKLTSSLLLDLFGIHLGAITAPIVPQGAERLRITPSPQHSADQTEALTDALMELGTEMGWRSRNSWGAQRATG